MSNIEGGREDKEHSFAVGIRLANGNVCSGVLIAPNVVLTAQHCISTATGRKVVDCKKDHFTNPIKGEDIVVTTGVSLPKAGTVAIKAPTDDSNNNETTKKPTATTRDDGDNGRYYGVERVVVPDERDLCGADIALLILSSLAKETPAVPHITSAMTPARIGKIAAIGYGASGERKADSGRRRIKDGISILCVPGGASSKDCTTDSPREFRTEGGVCLGDAGSGAFKSDKLDSQPVVFGILSRADSADSADGGGTCSEGVYTRTDLYGPLIATTVIAASTSVDGARRYPLPGWVVPASTADDTIPRPTFGDPPSASSCVPNQEVACLCGLSKGTQKCTAAGNLGRCECDDGSAASSSSQGDSSWDVSAILEFVKRVLPKLVAVDDGKERPSSVVTCNDGTTRDTSTTTNVEPCSSSPADELPAGGDRSYPSSSSETSTSSSEDESDTSNTEDEGAAGEVAPKRPKKKADSGCAMASMHVAERAPSGGTILVFALLLLAALRRAFCSFTTLSRV